jgi:hypothetical protein
MSTARLTWTFPTSRVDPTAPPLVAGGLSYYAFDTASPTPSVPIASSGGYSPGDAGSAAILNLVPGSNHGFYVIDGDGSLLSAPSATINVTMPSSPPNPVTNFNVAVF